MKEGGEFLAAHTTLPPVKSIFAVWGRSEEEGKLFLFFSLQSPPPQFFILVSFYLFPAWEPLACPGTRGGVCQTVTDKPWKDAGEGGGREFFLDGGDGDDNRGIGWGNGLRDTSWTLQSCSSVACYCGFCYVIRQAALQRYPYTASDIPRVS